MSKGEILLDIPPRENNPRNSEGTFISLADSGLLFMYSEFHGEYGADHADADIVKIVSHDNGNTWTSPETVVSAKEHGAMNVMSLSLMRMKNGDVGLFYLVRKSWTDMRVVLRRSQDEGKSWSDAKYCIERKAFYVINNDRAVRLSDGRIILPTAEHPITVNDSGDVVRYGPAVGSFFYSDDDGGTWHEADMCVSLNIPHADGGFQEPGIIEYKNGVLGCFARTSLGCHYISYSHDRGRSWTAPVPTRFTAPLSPLSMKRLSSGKLFAVWNPIPAYQTRRFSPATGGRFPLVYSLSSDDGTSWSYPYSLETDEDAGYCYTAIYERDGLLFLSYCAGNARVDEGCLDRTRIRRIRTDEIENG
ncbi:MAG: glycoside hydrolase [Firmicutes bacterium]|nr:glycoside hydrolase [Bacillota bacterium]